jgi:Lon protease-like protein
LFPSVVQPFQIFEPRYRAMTAHALSGHRLIAMAVLKPRWESQYELKTVPIQPVVCVGKITLDERLADGRYVLMLRGVCRARIIEELKGPESFRLGRLEALPDFMTGTPMIDREHRRAELLSLFQTLFPGVASRSTLAPLMEEKVTLSSICDVLAFAMKMPSAEAYRVLGEPNVDVRSELVLEHLKLRVRAERSGLVEATFPPAFSAN